MKLKRKYPIALRPPLSTADLVQHYDFDEIEDRISHLAKCCYDETVTFGQQVEAFENVLAELFATRRFLSGARKLLWIWWSKGWQDASYGAKP